MTRIIDNSKEKLYKILKQEFNENNEIAIASAYFNVRGFGLLKDALGNKPLYFLLGREPTESIKWEDEILRELEEREDDAEYFKLLQDAIKYFEEPDKQVRILTGPFFHGKAYIAAYPSLQKISRGVGCVGSSNFTYGGLSENRELNMVSTDREVVEDLANWFNEQWNKADDYKDEFLKILKNYVTTRTPLEVVAKALYETYKSSLEIEKTPLNNIQLYPHQILSYRDALEKLKKYGGVLIADSTGLGKSRIAIQLAINAMSEGRKVLLIAPKSVLETTWENEMQETKVFIKKINSEMLSSNPDDVIKEYEGYDFIIVDEAHYFRNPSTNRYSALRELILKNKAQIVLMTATPINTGLMDLYNLLSLYLGENSIFDLYGQTLRGFFTESQKKWIQNQPLDLEPVLERFIVRHSRELAKLISKNIKFPKRKIDEDPRDKYETNINYQKIYDILDKMNFVYYELSIEKLSDLKMPDGSPLSKYMEEKNKENLKKLVKTIVIINILKRLESSLEAFRKTLSTLKDYIKNAISFAENKGYFLPPALKDVYISIFDEEIPSEEDLFNKPKYKNMKEKCKLTKEEIENFINKCNEDLEKIRTLLEDNTIFLENTPYIDIKYKKFEERILDIIKEIKSNNSEISNNGIIIFSQYKDTVEYIYNNLNKLRLEIPLMMVTGTYSYNQELKRSSDKTGVINEFTKKGGILVSTDVLSEGLNLQNAQYIVNYDFPWNPVILIQRVGRIDRIGSPYDFIYLINILPLNGDPDDPSTLEHFLNLMYRLYKRLEAIRETIGLDASTLGEEAAPKDFGIQMNLAKNNQEVLEILSKQLEQFTNDPRDILAKIINEKGYDWIKKIPNGIGAYKIGDRDGLFILFTDGEEFYWRLKFFDGKGELLSSSNEIIDILLKGENENSGEEIEYSLLVDRMKKIKEELKKEINKRKSEIYSLSLGTDKKTREIYDALSKSNEADGEHLALLFRKKAKMRNVVESLYKAMLEGNLINKAREILKEDLNSEVNDKNEKEKNLVRVCWCWIHPKK